MSAQTVFSSITLRSVLPWTAHLTLHGTRTGSLTIRMLSVLLFSVLQLYPISHSAEIHLQDNPKGIWSLAKSGKDMRWIVIHSSTKTEQAIIYHIEVLGRSPSDPAWKIKHLVAHMAITEQALTHSVVAPLASGYVYPETYDSAYRAWQAQNNGLGGAVCQIDINHCAKP